MTLSCDDECLQPMLLLQVQNFRRDDLPAIEQTIRRTLTDLCEQGLDREQIEASLASFEFRLRERDYGTALELYERFLPYVDNWATCDQLPVKVLAKCPDETLERVDRWLASKHCYTIRFGIGVLMRLYLDELFDERFLAMVAQTRMPDTEECPASDDDIYYVDMMRAWYFAEALARQEKAALSYLERQGDEALLDEWTRRKGIQKAIESRRITDEMKAHLRTLR